ncbi:Versicolorin B synthase [Cytospora mali]|uniref:Versicolorin B synthase n=1 Tax=Cytospora mali TaxID=578113 RepID=A0A194VS39_CYTMA|nr:Versicolorin B synthase [Valsa mali]
MAKRIIFDNSKRATGVQVDTSGLGYTISAAKEVIVSGGVFGSPQLLQASGIGPAELLSQYDIPVVADRPGVGQGMQDHIYYTVSYRVNAPTLSKLDDPAFAAQEAAAFRKTGGCMYSNPVTEVIGWEKIPEPLRSETMSNSTLGVLGQYPADWPEVEYISVSGFVGYQNSTTAAPPNGDNYASLAVVLITPRSRGSVNITSADTYVHPAINPNFLVDPVDVDVTLAGFKRARQFWETGSMAGFRIGDEYFPGNSTQTEDEIKAFIRQAYNTIFHGSCTCAMGKTSDVNAVVDSEARVIGVQGLRVVDASAFPFLPPGHPQSTIYALAEKISCVISGNCD